jgi:NMD protein affecting ribosome stability and mRNA decay
MIQDGQMTCDNCGKPISRLTTMPEEGYPKMHSLCSACFADVWKKSIPPA